MSSAEGWERWSSSTTVGPTPRPKRRRLTTVHMQQPLMLKTTTALHSASCRTTSYGFANSISIACLNLFFSSLVLILCECC